MGGGEDIFEGRWRGGTSISPQSIPPPIIRAVASKATRPELSGGRDAGEMFALGAHDNCLGGIGPGAYTCLPKLFLAVGQF